MENIGCKQVAVLEKNTTHLRTSIDIAVSSRYLYWGSLEPRRKVRLLRQSRRVWRRGFDKNFLILQLSSLLVIEQGTVLALGVVDVAFNCFV